jgi:transposase
MRQQSARPWPSLRRSASSLPTRSPRSAAAWLSSLYLVYTPAYDPDANRIEWLWRIARRAVTHNHHRDTWEELQADIRYHFAILAQHPNEVLHHIGSAFAVERTPPSALALAA